MNWTSRDVDRATFAQFAAAARGFAEFHGAKQGAGPLAPPTDADIAEYHDAMRAHERGE